MIDGTGRAPIPEAVIVIEGDKFQIVGGKATDYPSNATVMDLAGKFIIPGLVDSHSHCRSWCGELYLNHGVTTYFFWNPRSYYGHTEESYRASQESSIRAPRRYDRGAGLSLSPSMTREQVGDAVAQMVKSKPDFVGMSFGDSNKQVYRWAVEDIHEAGLFVVGHTTNAPESTEAGHDGVEHVWAFVLALMSPQELEGYRKGEYLHWGSFLKDKAQRIDEMIQAAVARGAYLNPTLIQDFSGASTLAHQYELDTYALSRIPALMTYYPDQLPVMMQAKYRSARTYSTRYPNFTPLSQLGAEDVQEYKDAYRLSGEFVKRWVELGGKIIGGTDDPGTGTPGLGLHVEMAMLVESGLTPMQALQAATLWGAEILTARKKTPTNPPVGLVAEGAYADLVVLKANPLDDIQNTRKIERVMKGGKFVELGYTPYYAAKGNMEGNALDPAVPELSAIVPHTVVAGIPEFEMTVEGEGFVASSVVQIDGLAIPTTFVNSRTLKAIVPAKVVARATPDPFRASGPGMEPGVFGDRTVKITVYNGPTNGGGSNRVSLRIIAKWLAEKGTLGGM